MRSVTFSQFRNNAKKYFDAVEKGETLEIYRHGKPIATLSPSRSVAQAPYRAEEDAAPYSIPKSPRLSPSPHLSPDRELLRDRGREVIPISHTKRFIRSKFGALESGGKLLRTLIQEKGREREKEESKWRRRKK